ncbi:MAG TPA: glycerol-3-phosphate 1-O-acyltransferase PlsY [Longimicrobiales bacterium]|nr:glycerol-3-phosphate 1-O-acyltransferase PlsY [Longimicrobiales bacterium]
MTYALLAASYLLGSIPTSYLVGRIFHGIDLRRQGSGNLGATNAFRVLGAAWALPVVIVDVAKGFVPVVWFTALAGADLAWTLAFGAAAVLGHMFSVWVGFRGGKGMATSAGVFLGLAPWAVLGGLAVWCALTFPTGYVSVGSIGAALALPVLVALTPHRGGDAVLWFSAAAAAVVIWAHRANIRRLARGEENRFGRRARARAGSGRESAP